MTYNELIRKYRDGQLEGDARREVESDIERHEAISEYLLDREEQDDAALTQAFAMEDRTVSGSGDNPDTSSEAAFAARPLPRGSTRRSEKPLSGRGLR